MQTIFKCTFAKAFVFVLKADLLYKFVNALQKPGTDGQGH